MSWVVGYGSLKQLGISSVVFWWNGGIPWRLRSGGAPNEPPQTLGDVGDVCMMYDVCDVCVGLSISLCSVCVVFWKASPNAECDGPL